MTHIRVEQAADSTQAIHPAQAPRSRARALAVLALALSAGCTKSAPPSPSHDGGAAVATSADGSAFAASSATPAKRPSRPFRRPGLAGLALNSSHDLDLTDAQSTSVEQIQQQLSTGDPGAQAQYQQFQTDVASGIRAGKFDGAKMQGDYDAFDKTRLSDTAKEATALNDLHAALTVAQRTALVADLKTKEAGFDAQKPPPDAPDGGLSDRSKRTLDKMTQDLTLDPGQQKQVAAILAKDERSMSGDLPTRREEMKKRLESFISAFEAPDFDASKLDLADYAGKTAHEPLAHEVSFLSQLLTILKPAQREKLAAGPARGPGGMGGAPGMGGHPGFGGPGMGRPGMGPGMSGPGMSGPGMSGPRP